MKRSFREPKNLFKNKAKNDCKKMNSIKSTHSLKNKGKMKGKRGAKKPNIAQDTAQIRLIGQAKRD